MTSPPPDGVVVTPEQMYAEVRGLHDTVIRMDGKLDALGQQKTVVDDHEVRIRDLESRRFPHSTVSAVSAGIAALATAITVWQATGH